MGSDTTPVLPPGPTTRCRDVAAVVPAVAGNHSMTNDTQETNAMPQYMKVPLDWCRIHHASRDEDADHCDLATVCRPCHGTGFSGDYSECGFCEGIGREACDLTPLMFEAAR